MHMSSLIPISFRNALLPRVCHIDKLSILFKKNLAPLEIGSCPITSLVQLCASLDSNKKNYLILWSSELIECLCSSGPLASLGETDLHPALTTLSSPSLFVIRIRSPIHRDQVRPFASRGKFQRALNASTKT